MSRSKCLGTRLVAKPLYGQVKESLLDRIGSGEWRAGQPLPNETTLADQFDVSIGTVRKAVEGLQEAGVLIRQQGRGTFIAGRGAGALDQRFDRLMSVRTGRPVALGRHVLEHVERPLTMTEQLRFSAEPGESGIVVCQAVSSGGRRIGWERSVLQSKRLAGIEVGIGQSLYDAIGARGVLPTRVQDRIGAVRIDAAMARSSGLPQGETALVIDRRTFGLSGDVVELRYGVYASPDIVYEVTA